MAPRSLSIPLPQPFIHYCTGEEWGIVNCQCVDYWKFMSKNLERMNLNPRAEPFIPLSLKENTEQEPFKDEITSEICINMALEYLKNKFPDSSEKFLREVYTRNNFDLDIAIDFLTQHHIEVASLGVERGESSNVQGSSDAVSDQTAVEASKGNSSSAKEDENMNKKNEKEEEEEEEGGIIIATSSSCKKVEDGGSSSGVKTKELEKKKQKEFVLMFGEIATLIKVDEDEDDDVDQVSELESEKKNKEPMFKL